LPTTIYDVAEIELSNGTVIKVKPLTISYLKEFMVVLDKMKDESVKTEADILDVFIEAGMVCMKMFAPELATDKDSFEKVIEVPTLMKILEVAGGVKMDSPNSPLANLAGTN
jgi:hypothetical protein